MNQSPSEVKGILRTKIGELARALGNNASKLRDDEMIPETGILDSPALLELILFFEQKFGVDIDQNDLNIENFGTLDSMAAYLERVRQK